MRRSHSGERGEVCKKISKYPSAKFYENKNSFFLSAGYSYEPLPSTSGDALEEENERMAEELQGKIHALKSLSIDIGTEVKYQHKMLNDMVHVFSYPKIRLTVHSCDN